MRALVCALILLTACASPLDHARKEFTVALQVAQSAHVRLKTYDSRHQIDLVRANAGSKEKAAAALLAYRAKRQAVTEQASRTEAVMDTTADVLLLGDAPVGVKAAADAKASALALRDAVARLMGGQ